MSKYYDCYSYNLKKFLSLNGLEAVKVTKHFRTHRSVWVYERNAQLDALLEEWTNNKK